MKAGILPMHINSSMCSYETKKVISCSPGNLNGQIFCNVKVKWTRYSVQKLLSHYFKFFVAVYHILYTMQ